MHVAGLAATAGLLLLRLAVAYRADSSISLESSFWLESDVLLKEQAARSGKACSEKTTKESCRSGNACFYRPSLPKKDRCAERLPVNCKGQTGDDCKGPSKGICEWRWNDNWETSCVGRGSRPDGAKTWSEEFQEAWGHATQSRCWLYFWKSADQCYQARFVIGPTFAVLLLCTCCCLCCCCCGSSSGGRRTSDRSSKLFRRPMPAPARFPEPPAPSRQQITIPDHIQPGQPFNFKHPKTGQIMQAVAPPDGSRIVEVQV